jgi:hypothetical protein
VARVADLGTQQRHLRLVHGVPRRRKGTVPPKRDRKLARVRAGTAHAALVFDGDDCLGWCQFGAPDEVPRIKSRAAYEKGLTTLPDWRIACNFVGKGHRRQGVATAALAGALDLIAGLGGGRVEGYPEDASAVPAGFLFTVLSTYETSGFVRDARSGTAGSLQGGRPKALAASRAKGHLRTWRSCRYNAHSLRPRII